MRLASVAVGFASGFVQIPPPGPAFPPPTEELAILLALRVRAGCHRVPACAADLGATGRKDRKTLIAAFCPLARRYF